MLRMASLIILLVVISGPSQALTEARLLNKSATGQTVIFNMGSHDGIKSGDYAVVIKEIRDLESRDLRLIPVAKARNVKINSDSSVWILYKVFDQELLVKGEKFNLLTESHVMSGRRLPELGRLTVVSPKKDLEANAKEAEVNDQDRLGRLKDKYEVLTPTHETPSVSGNDADLIDLEVWKENKSSRYRSSIYKSADKAEFRKQLRLATFEKIVTAFLERVNDPDFNYDTFYEKQRKTLHSNEANANGIGITEYEGFLRKEAFKTTADAKLYRSILEKGESWSEDYSDEELRKVLNQVSVLQEKDRRVLVMAKPTRFGLVLDYGFSLSDAQTDKDPLYQRKNRYSTELDFEVTPFLKHDALERLTFNATFRLNHTAFEAQDVNADLDEYSLSLGANYYPLNAPYAVEAPIFFLGSYVRSGFAKANSPTANEQANYTVLSLPGFRAGFKYLLKNHIGVRLVLNMETLTIDRYEASQVQSILPETSNLVEAKLGAGIAYAF